MAKVTQPKQALSPAALDKIAVKIDKAVGILVSVLQTLDTAEKR